MRILIASVLGVGVLVFAGLAGVAGAQSALQFSPDGKRTLIEKRVGDEFWAITMSADDNTVSGNVLVGEGAGGASEPAPNAQFLYCTPNLTADRKLVSLDCEAALPCLVAPCDPAAWQPAGQVGLPLSFFYPPAGPTPTPVPTSALRELQGVWRFTIGTLPPTVVDYTLADVLYQFARPVLVGSDGGGEPLTVTYYAELVDQPPFRFVMLDPGATGCFLNVFSRTFTGGIAGLTYALPVDGSGNCLGVVAGQPSYPLSGIRTGIPGDGGGAQGADEETAASLSRAVDLLAPTLP